MLQVAHTVQGARTYRLHPLLEMDAPTLGAALAKLFTIDFLHIIWRVRCGAGGHDA